MKKIRLVEAYSGELERIRKLFIKGYKSYLSSRSRRDRLEFILEILQDILPEKSDLKLLMVALNKHYSSNKKENLDEIDWNKIKKFGQGAAMAAGLGMAAPAMAQNLDFDSNWGYKNQQTQQQPSQNISSNFQITGGKDRYLFSKGLADFAKLAKSQGIDITDKQLLNKSQIDLGQNYKAYDIGGYNIILKNRSDSQSIAFVVKQNPQKALQVMKNKTTNVKTGNEEKAIEHLKYLYVSNGGKINNFQIQKINSNYPNHTTLIVVK